jgi:hypothetical protein
MQTPCNAAMNNEALAIFSDNPYGKLTEEYCDFCMNFTAGYCYGKPGATECHVSEFAVGRRAINAYFCNDPN